MNKTRYKIRKEQLERVVESFVTESVAPESKKHVQGYKDTEDESLGMKDGKESTKKASVKGRRDDSKGKWGNRLKHASEAKKHRMSMGTEQSNDMGQGMKKAPQTTSTRMKHSAEAKKYVRGSVSESQNINEVDPITVGLGVGAIFAAAGGMTALEGYIDKLEKKDPSHRLVKMLKGLRDLGKATADAKRGTKYMGEEKINEVDPVTVGLGITGLIALAGGAAALEGYSDKLKKTKPNHPLVKVFDMLQAAGKATADAKRGNRY